MGLLIEFEVSVIVKIQDEDFWVGMTCSIVVGYQHCGASECRYPTATLHSIMTE